MATGIIAEYNPFHKGHKYHIEKTAEKTNEDIVALISGNFVQRGEPAMLEKHIRTKMALLNGVSMVLELPVEYATGAADVFAMGAAYILEKSGIINFLSFGSEAGTTSALEKTAIILNNEPPKFKTLMKDSLDKGYSYPLARNKALEAYLNKKIDFLNKPNNILGLEYIRALKNLNSKIKPVTIERIISDYNSSRLSGEISSASAIRTAILNKDYSALSSIPQNITDLINCDDLPTLNDFTQILMYILRTQSSQTISQYADVTEGLENRITNTDFTSINELIDKIKTKRYTYSKLRKAILHIILGVTKEMQSSPPRYIRVLGIRSDKEYLLKSLFKKSQLPVIVNVKANENLLSTEIRTTDIYNIPLNKKSGLEYTTPLVIV